MMPKSQIPDELVSLRKERSKTFDLGNGKKQFHAYCKPIHYENGGGWSEIEVSFRDDGDKFTVSIFRSVFSNFFVRFVFIDTKVRAEPNNPV